MADDLGIKVNDREGPPLKHARHLNQSRLGR
jgi:hypothetical protein